jgi:hypothetical protein
VSAAPKFGATGLAPVTVLPELAIDLSLGQVLPSRLGKTEAPLRMLPELEIEFSPTVPVLELRLVLRPQVPSWQVSLDLFRLYAAVNQLDLRHQGSGLLPAEASYDQPNQEGVLSVRFKPFQPQGAAERLGRLASAINEAQEYPSLLRCEAKVVCTAA